MYVTALISMAASNAMDDEAKGASMSAGLGRRRSGLAWLLAVLCELRAVQLA